MEDITGGISVVFTLGSVNVSVRPSVRLVCFLFSVYSPGANKATRFVTTSGLAQTQNNPELVRIRYASDLNKAVACRKMCMLCS